MRKAKLICIVISLLLIAFTANAAETDKEEVKRQQITEAELQEFFKPTKFLPGEILFYCDLYEGYDNNVNLDSSRDGDFYTELALEVGYKQPLRNGFDATLDYYLSAINYQEITDGSFYDNSLSIELEKDLLDALLKLGIGNNFEYIHYPKEENSIFYAAEPEIFIQHNISKSIYQKLIYNFMFREYTDRKALDGLARDKDSDRRDTRNSLTHEARAIIFEKYILQLRNQYFVNDSNDQYMDYYDYSSYRIDGTLILPLFFERLYGLISGGYQLRDYKTRQLVNNVSQTQEDDFYNTIASVIYDLNDTFSISLNYKYSQNESNEPSEEYSGSIFSLGLHYAF